MNHDEKPVVLITGCSSGIGRATARVFAQRGYRVYATMRRASAGQELRDEAAAAGWFLETPELDVTRDDVVRDVVARILEETGGRLDVVINNAGRYVYGPMEQTTPEEFHAQLDTNVVGMLRVCRAVLPAMRARRSGTLVNISSLTGLNVIPIVGAYQISKWAVEAFTETLRYELCPFGIRVVCIEPGPFETELHHNETQTEESRDPSSPYAGMLAAYRRNLAAQRRARVPDVVETIYRAATAGRPKLRWPVGPLSFVAGWLSKFVPDFIVEWVVRRTFALRPPA